MAWLIIGCTLLIIVCLGGGKKLAKIMLGAAAAIGVLVLVGTSGTQEIPLTTLPWVIVAIGGFFALMIMRGRGVNLDITHMRHHDPKD